MKEQINKEIADILLRIPDVSIYKSEINDVWNFFYDFIGETSMNFRKRNNITYDLLQRIYDNGWQEEYIFKIGDIVEFKGNKKIQTIVMEYSENMANEISLEYVQENPNEFNLVCKKENKGKY